MSTTIPASGQGKKEENKQRWVPAGLRDGWWKRLHGKSVKKMG